MDAFGQLRRRFCIAKQIDHRNIARLTNTKLVLQELFNQPETSRAAIARNLGLNKATVSSIYKDLAIRIWTIKDLLKRYALAIPLTMAGADLN